MRSPFFGFGTLLNVLAVVIGSVIGLGAGQLFSSKIQEVSVFGIGLITLCLGVQMFFRSKNPLIVVMSITLGSLIGVLFGLDVGLNNLAEFAKTKFTGDAKFNQGFITSCVLFCIGPMTLMGCLEDAIERKVNLLGLKSFLDGVSSIFLAATLGFGVLVSALFVLIFQGILTLFARYLSGFANDESLVGETVACGGVIMVSIGFGITGLKESASVLLLPSLLIAPGLVKFFEFIERRKNPTSGNPPIA